MPNREKPLAADSEVKLPLATSVPTSRPSLGFTIFRSIATEPVRRALVFSNVGLATARPAPVAAAGGVPAMAPPTPRATPPAPRGPPPPQPLPSPPPLHPVPPPPPAHGP